MQGHACGEEKVMTTGAEENKPGCCSLILSKRDQVKMCSFFVGPPTALLATPATLNLSDNPDHFFLLVMDTVHGFYKINKLNQDKDLGKRSSSGG